LVLAAEAFVLARAADQTWEIGVEGAEAAASGGDKDKIISWNIGHFVCKEIICQYGTKEDVVTDSAQREEEMG
jgi:hypothetical protein